MVRRIGLRYSILIVAVMFVPTQSRGQGAVDDAAVELAIGRAVDFLWSRQGAAGGWSEPQFDFLYPGGVTSLVAFTLRTAGVSANDERLQRAVKLLLETYDDVRSTYGRSFRLMLWTTLDPKKYAKQLKEDTRALVTTQRADGVWGYGSLGGGMVMAPPHFADNSNTQLAILALWEASQAGGEVGRATWQKAEAAWLACQNEDGGWGYAPVDNINDLRPDSYGSMTAAGLATMYILYDQLYARSEGRFDGRRAPNCRYDHPKSQKLRQAVEQGWNWLNMRFVADRNPEFSGGNLVGQDDWLTYYLYSIERAGVASGFKRFGINDWYGDVATQLVRTQQADGSWGSVYQTCFGLLALVKGRTPIVISKLKYGAADDWNNDPRDAATLTRWLSRKLETPLTWQVVDLATEDGAYIDTPILYVSGHEVPEFAEHELTILRDYIAGGGTIVAVACCSKAAFARGMEKVLDTALPRLRRETLNGEHPFWTLHYKCPPSDDVIGYSDGCRTRAFLLTTGVCCAWQQDLAATQEPMFQLGANLMLYATGKTRPRSVNRTDLAGRGAGQQAATGQTLDAVVKVGRIVHDGDYWVDPFAMQNLSRAMVEHWNIAVAEEAEVDPAAADLATMDAVWLTGHTVFSLTDSQEEAIKEYAAEGGTVLATACCGRSTFDLAFGQLMESMYGIDKLESVPADDPIITGRFPGMSARSGLGSNLADPEYKPVATATTRQSSPEPSTLKGVRRPDGSWAVLYSPIDIHCGCDGHYCIGCSGFTPRDAKATAGNMLLYVLLRRGR